MNKSNILIVEDDAIHAFIAEAQLKEYYNTHWVDNGHEALKAIEKQKYEVILMDINLNDPAMDGIKTMRTIRFNRKHRHTKIIALTAASDAREWFIKQGFDGHYMKPITVQGLLEEINKEYTRTSLIY
ncbi:MAG TPA: response regulator [Bacteroidia bacterium]|jgi:CheY-like chemotaxis protein|nr:response regulator [Bacteroidia bacterium]